MLPDRRTFLRGLVSLPLIGGGVTLIGNPQRVAFATSDHLREQYLGWLRLEHTKLCHEIVDCYCPEYGRGAWCEHAPAFRLPDTPEVAKVVGASSATSRAAVILSAAGVPWTNAGAMVGRSIANGPQHRDDLDPFKVEDPSRLPGRAA